MTFFTHILVPTDFGEPAERALDVAVGLASKFDSKVTLVHASWVPMATYATYEAVRWPVDELEVEAQKTLDAALSKLRERWPRAEGVVVRGEPWQAILDEAQRRGCDLIVMGTHGRRGLSHVLLGSVAERVVRLSPVPVLTISGKADQQAKATAVAQATTKTQGDAGTPARAARP